MVSVFDMLATLLSFLPAWFAVFVGVALSVLMMIALMRLIAFIMEIIPFI